MNDNDFHELVSAFIAETQEFLQSLETLLLTLETDSISQRQAAVKEMFRAAHSIKGSASMLGFNDLAVAAHTLEDCFAILRDRADLSAINSSLITQLLAGVDHLKTITNQTLDPSILSAASPDGISVTLADLQAAISSLKIQLENQYGSAEISPPSVLSQAVNPETVKVIFENELPPVLNQLEAELSQVQASNLSEKLAAINQIYYQLSGLSGMLQLPEFGKLAEPLRELIDTPNLSIQQLQSTGWIIAQNLQTACQQICAGQIITVVPDSEISQISDPETPEDNLQKLEPNPALEKVSQSSVSNPQRPTIRVDLERLTELVNLVGELVINRTNIELQESQLRAEVKHIRRSILELNQFGSQLREEYDRLAGISTEEWENQKSKIQREKQVAASLAANFQSLVSHTPSTLTPPLFDPLEMDQYTEFHSTVQEVLETTYSITQSATKLDSLATNFERSTDHLRRITEQLRHRVMQLRVVNFSRAVDHLPRALRQMCLANDKDVNLLLLGRDTKIDESLLDALRDPLVHLVRNAFDHGIEPPDVRIAAGKPPSGQIEIEARHQGGQTIITISDDGKGIDPETIRDRAVERGLVTPEIAAELSIAELYEFLFWPGFSTATQVTSLSGRGVGLDIVRTNLRPVRGTVKVDSRLGKGTTFIIKLPLMLSIADALLVKTDHNIVAVPLDAVEEILHIQGEQIHHAGTQPMLWWRDEFIRLVRLQTLLHYTVSLLDVPSPDPLTQEHIPVVVLASSEGILAVAVERLVGQQEIVVKPLPPPLSKPRGIVGSTILGDGKVVTIIDVDDLVSQFHHDSTAVAVPHKSVLAPMSRQAPQILVVDDSYTIRQLLQLTLSRARYRVIQAKDGVDAMEKLQNGLDCDLVIADIEMPRMDGFELLKAMKAVPQFSRIPVAMLTSRSGAKHRQMALELGANQYFTKPYSEAQLLEAISGLLKHKDST